MIPRVLHRVVPRRDDETASRYWDRLRELHPGWEFRTWRDPLDPTDFELGPLFERCGSGAQLADLVRLEVLWRYGGVYLDTDCEPVKPFDGLLHHGCFVGTEDGELLSNAVIGAEAHHPAIRACMDRIVGEGRVDLAVPPNESTGPVLLTEVMAGRTDVVVLPPEFFYPYHYSASRPTSVDLVATRFTVVVHQWEGSWRPRPDGSTAGRAREVARSISRSAKSKAVRAVQRVGSTLGELGSGVRGAHLGDGRVLVRLWDGRPLIAHARDLSITPELLAHGTYDQRFCSFLMRLLKPGDRVVDVGANVGLFTVTMAARVGRFGHVDAFEPDPEVFEILEDNVALNWLSGRVTSRCCAAGNDATAVEFARDARFRGSSAALFGAQEREGQSSDSISVRSVRLDEELSSDLPIRLVKIDVEGGEPFVLEGMTGLLERRLVRMISVEVVRSNAGLNWDRFVAALRTLTDRYGASTNVLTNRGDLRPVHLDHVIARAGHFAHVVFVFPEDG